MSDDEVVQMRRSKVYTLELMGGHMQTRPVVLFMKGIFQFRSASVEETGKFEARKGR